MYGHRYQKGSHWIPIVSMVVGVHDTSDIRPSLTVEDIPTNPERQLPNKQPIFIIALEKSKDGHKITMCT